MPSDLDTVITPQFVDRLMNQALELAEQAAERGEVPVGALVWCADAIIGSGTNQVEEDQDATAHAEILAIRRAGNTLQNWRLSNSIMLVTLEPCLMCLAAIQAARVPVLIYGASQPGLGAVETGLNPSGLRIIRGIREESCTQLMQRFFRSKR
jgi:tRNA(adenine34) deaminase